MGMSSQNLLCQEIREFSQKMCVRGECARKLAYDCLVSCPKESVEEGRDHSSEKHVVNDELLRTEGDTSDPEKSKRCPEMGISEQPRRKKPF